MPKDKGLVTAAALIGAASIGVYWVLLSRQSPHDYGVVPLVVTLTVGSSLAAGAAGWLARARPWGRTAVMTGVVGLAFMGLVGAASIGMLWLMASVLLLWAARRVTVNASDPSQRVDAGRSEGAAHGRLG